MLSLAPPRGGRKALALYRWGRWVARGGFTWQPWIVLLVAFQKMLPWLQKALLSSFGEEVWWKARERVDPVVWFVKHVVYFLIFEDEDCFVPLSSSLDLFQLEAVLIEPVHLHCTG